MKAIIITIFLSSSWVWAECIDYGFSSVWEFDQAKSEIKLIDHTEQKKICGTFKEQIKSNIQIDFFADDIVIHTIKLLWPEMTTHDVFNQNKLVKNIPTHETQTKILKVPLKLSQVDSYLVTHLHTKKIMGKGKIK